MNVNFEYANNPKLAALFKDWPVGERYQLVLDFQLDQKDEKGASGSIEEVFEMGGGAESKEKTAAGEEDETARPKHNEPMMVLVAGGKRRQPMKKDMLGEGMMEEPAYG